MKRSDLKNLNNANPLLRLLLHSVGDTELEWIHIVSENTIAELNPPFYGINGKPVDDSKKNLAAYSKYLQYCAKLGISNPPALIVLDGPSRFTDPHAEGSFMPALNAICIPRYAFSSFADNIPKSDYVMSHEIGHAKDLSYDQLAAIVGISLLAGTVTDKTLSAATQKILKNQNVEEKRAKKITRRASFAYALGGAGAAALACVRSRELAADKHAGIVLTDKAVLQTLLSESEELLIEQWGRDKTEKVFDNKMEQTNAALKKAGLNRSEEEVRILSMLGIVEDEIAKQTPLTKFVRNFIYPNALERTHNLSGNQSLTR